MNIAQVIREASRQFDRDQAFIANYWYHNQPDDCAIWDSAGDELIYDEDGFCLNEYIKVGSEPLTPYEAMIAALIYRPRSL